MTSWASPRAAASWLAQVVKSFTRMPRVCTVEGAGADARRVESVLVVTQVCCDIATLTGVEGKLQAQLAAAVSDAERWLEGQTQVRRELFLRLEEALAARDAVQVGQLLARVNATASHDRTADEHTIADVAAEYLAEQRQAHAEQLQARQGTVRRSV